VLELVCINTVSPIPVKLAGGKDYEYVVVDNRAVYMRPLQLKLEAFKVFKCGKKLHKIVADNAHELLMGEVCDICEQDGIPRSRIILRQMERLKRLDDWAKMSYFIGYKYEGGGYRV